MLEPLCSAGDKHSYVGAMPFPFRPIERRIIQPSLTFCSFGNAKAELHGVNFLTGRGYIIFIIAAGVRNSEELNLG